MWSARAMHEIRNSQRTWFATITVRPEEQYKFLVAALERRRRRASITDGLSDEEEFALRVTEAGKAITLALKRLRKDLGEARSMRYLLVAEQHKSGLPHFHMLIHESGATPIKKAQLDAMWPHGFTQFKLLGDDLRAAWYVVKYLGKAQQARVRASLRYGRMPYDLNHSEEHERELLSVKDKRMSQEKTETPSVSQKSEEC